MSKRAAEGVLHLQVLGRQASIGVHSSGSHEGEEAVQGGVGCGLWLQVLSTICTNPLPILLVVTTTLSSISWVLARTGFAVQADVLWSVEVNPACFFARAQSIHKHQEAVLGMKHCNKDSKQ